MCGIAGFIQPRTARWDDQSVIRAMTDALRHRGPDDGGSWHDADTGVCLGHRRLSIIDLSAEGHQPMATANGRYALTYNGEVYNFAELRRELDSAGHRFRGSSDTEVILEAFARFGVEQTISRLNGIFAFALFDRERRRLVLARDHLGVKPLYYGVVGGGFAFASELAAFRAIPGFAHAIDTTAVHDILRYSYVPAPRSIFLNISKLLPGSLLEVDVDDPTREPRVTQFWSAREVAESGYAHPMDCSPAECVDGLEQVLRTAVRAQMVSDVPIGAFLSGGLDSSTIVALMQAQSPRPVKTFSIGFAEGAYDEAKDAARVAQHLGTDHTELYVRPEDALAVIPQLPTIYDEPFADSSQIPTYLVSRLARQSVTVSLSGDGGDELFAGYNRHVLGESLWRRLSVVPRGVRLAARHLVHSVSPRTYDAGLSLLRYAGARRLPKRVGHNLHKAAGLFDARSSDELYERLTSHWSGPSGVANLTHATTDRYRDATLASFTERMMYSDLVTYLPDDILVKVDRASMAVALEARVPYLDPRVVEYAWRLPLGVKLRDGQGKWVLRQVLYRHVPKALVDRPKAGFGVPIDAWLRGPLREWAESLLSRDALRNSDVFDAGVIRGLWDAHLSHRVDAQYAVWNVLMFQAWDAHLRV